MTSTGASPPVPPITRVLLVDSRPILLDALTMLLEQYQPRLQVVGEARSYARALELTRQLRPDVILLSVFRDSIDVHDALAALIRHGCVVVLKGMHEDLPAAAALELGATAVVIAEQPAEAIVDAVLQASGPRPNGGPWIHARPGGGAPGAPQRRTAGDRLARLTARERELIRVLVANPGAKYLVIAAQMGISEHTVHNHLSSIYQKLQVVNRNDLLVYAVRNGLGEEPLAPGPTSDLGGLSAIAAPAAIRRGSGRPPRS